MPGVDDALELEALPLPGLLDTAQNLSQSWEWLLFASGGALELTKCVAYVMYWDLSGGTHRLVLPPEIPGCVAHGNDLTGPISLTYGDKHTQRFPLDTVSPWVGRRTLGVRIAPAGNWNDVYLPFVSRTRTTTPARWCCSVERNSTSWILHDGVPEARIPAHCYTIHAGGM